MKSALFLVLGLVAWTAAAQDRVAVTFKVFPPDYEVFVQGERLNYDPRGDGLRTYLLPAGATRVNLAAPLSSPLSLGLSVKAGMSAVQAKLEPRQGPLTLIGQAATGQGPRSVAFSADGKTLYVALQGENGADVYQIPSLKKTGRLLAPGAQGGVTDVIALGAEIWTVSTDGRVSTFDAATLAAKDSTTMTTGGNAFLADLGGRAAVVNWDTGQIISVDLTTKKPLASLSLTGSLRGFSSSHGLAYVSLFDKGQVDVIDAASWTVKTAWPAGRAPRPVAVTKGKLFVGDMSNASVLVLDAASGKVLDTVAVASNPHQMTVSKDGSMVAVASRGKNNPQDYQLAGPDFGKVTVFLASGEVAGSVWGKNQPTGLAFSPDGRYLAFTDFLDNNLELYRISIKAPR